MIKCVEKFTHDEKTLLKCVFIISEVGEQLISFLCHSICIFRIYINCAQID